MFKATCWFSPIRLVVMTSYWVIIIIRITDKQSRGLFPPGSEKGKPSLFLRTFSQCIVMKLSVGPGFSQLTGWTEQPLKVSLLPFVITFPTACFCHWCNCGSMNSSVANIRLDGVQSSGGGVVVVVVSSHRLPFVPKWFVKCGNSNFSIRTGS